MLGHFRRLAGVAVSTPDLDLFLYPFPDKTLNHGLSGGNRSLVGKTMELVENLATKSERHQGAWPTLGQIAQQGFAL